MLYVWPGFIGFLWEFPPDPMTPKRYGGEPYRIFNAWNGDEPMVPGWMGPITATLMAA